MFKASRPRRASSSRVQSERARSAELSRLVNAAGGDARRLSIREAARLAALYRKVATDALRQRRMVERTKTVLPLEGALQRAYAIVYATPRGWRLQALWRFLAVGFPRLVRGELSVVTLAASLVLAGALSGAAVMHLDPAAIAVVIPEMHQDQPPEERIRDEAQRAVFDPGSSVVFSSFLFTHNIQVTFLVLALGLSAGVGTAAVLFWNGVPLGALAAQYLASGNGAFFFAWILPHGVLELSVVAIAGGAGFVLARGLLRPGALMRRQALYLEAHRAIGLVSGGMPMLVVAGLVEGTLSQQHPPLMPLAAKFVASAVIAVGTLLYLGCAGRRARVPTDPLGSARSRDG